jgi:hypothetical protein
MFDRSRLRDTKGVLSEASPLFDADATPAEKAAVAISRKVAHEKASSRLDGPLVEDYKLEVFFGPGRTVHGPNKLKISIWESGRGLGGDADSLMLMCRDVTPGSRLGCGMPLGADYTGSAVSYCPRCNKGIVTAKLPNYEVYHNISSRNLAALLAKLSRNELKSRAAIYLKYDHNDIRRSKDDPKLGPDYARYMRERNTYSLDRLVKDSADGKSLEACLYGFITG